MPLGRALRSLVVAGLLLAVGCGNDGNDSASSDDDVRAAWTAYRDAIVAKDGEEAVKHLSPGTIAYYDRMRNLALDASEADLQRERLVDQVAVLGLRARIDVGLLRTGDARDIVVDAVDQGLIGDEVSRLDIGVVEATGDAASATVRQGETELPTRLSFRRVDRRWRVDLEPLLGTAETALQAAARGSASPKELVERLLARRVGPERAAQAWTPVGRA